MIPPRRRMRFTCAPLMNSCGSTGRCMPASAVAPYSDRDCFVAGLLAMTSKGLSLRAKRSNLDRQRARLRRVPRVYRQDGAGDVAGFIADQVVDSGGDVVGVGEAVERAAAGDAA